MKPKPFISCVAISAVIAVAACASPAQPQFSVSWLLNKVADAAEKKSRDARKLRRPADARIWQEWAEFYRSQAQSSFMTYTPALALLAENIDFYQDAADDMEKSREFEAVKFYKASVLFWEDVMRQLQRGGELKINFPEREMLTPVPGIPGTPWEFLRADPIGPADGEQCGQLYKKWRECDEEYEELWKTSPASHNTLMHNFHCVNLKYVFIRRCKP